MNPEEQNKMWVIRFKYITPNDYHTPSFYLPEEETHIEAKTADEAWEKFVGNEFAGNRSYYTKLEIYEHPWKKAMNAVDERFKKLRNGELPWKVKR